MIYFTESDKVTGKTGLLIFSSVWSLASSCPLLGAALIKVQACQIYFIFFYIGNIVKPGDLYLTVNMAEQHSSYQAAGMKD